VELGFISLSYLDSLSHLRRIVFVESEANDLQRQLNETSRPFTVRVAKFIILMLVIGHRK